MKKNSIFSKGLFIEALRKLKVVTIIFLAVIFLDQIVINLAQNAGMSADGAPAVLGAGDVMLSLVYIPLIMTPLMMLILFSSFNKRSSSDFYLALPFTRSCLALTWTLAAVVISAACVIIGTILGYIGYLFYPGLYILKFTGILSVLLTFLAGIIFAAGCAFIAVSVTGKIFSGTVLMLLIMYLPRYIMIVLREVILFQNTVLAGDYLLQFFTFKTNVFVRMLIAFFGDGLENLLYGTNVSLIYSEPWPLIYTLLLGLLYIALGTFLFKRRKSEIAGVAASPRINAAIRIAVGLTVSSVATFLILGTADYVNMSSFAAVTYIVALLIYLAYEIISTGKWKNLLTALQGALIVVVLNLLIVGFFYFGEMIAHSYVTDFNTVSAVTYLGDGNSDDDFFKEATHKVTLTDRDILDASYNAAVAAPYIYGGGDLTVDPGSYTVGRDEKAIIKVKTDNGTKYLRAVFTSEEYDELLKEIAASPDYIKALRDFPDDVEGTEGAYMKVTYSDSSMSSGSDGSDSGDEASDYESETVLDVLSEKEILKMFKKEFASLSDSGLSTLALKKLIGNNSLSVDAFRIKFMENAPGFEEYTFYVNPNYFPESAAAIFERNTKDYLPANLVANIFGIYDTEFAPLLESDSYESGRFTLTVTTYTRQSDGRYYTETFNADFDSDWEYYEFKDEGDTVSGYEGIKSSNDDQGAFAILGALEGANTAPNLDEYITVVFSYYGDYTNYKTKTISGILPMTDAAKAVIAILNESGSVLQ